LIAIQERPREIVTLSSSLYIPIKDSEYARLAEHWKHKPGPPHVIRFYQLCEAAIVESLQFEYEYSPDFGKHYVKGVTPEAPTIATPADWTVLCLWRKIYVPAMTHRDVGDLIGYAESTVKNEWKRFEDFMSGKIPTARGKLRKIN
jgi:hypothetical protein